MKILVLGSTGMLGHKMVERLRLYYTDVEGLSREDGFDAVDLPHVEYTLRLIRPNVVINCIGLIKQREQDLEKSIAVNALFPHFLQRICQQIGTKLIHFSTDCVFSGNRGVYAETDLSDAEDVYGRTKYLGEILADNALTLRTSIIGRERKNFHGLLEWFLRQEGIIFGYEEVFYTGVTTNWLADTVAALIQKPLSGLYQIASPYVSKFQLLEYFKEVYARKNIEIISAFSPLCDRTLCGEKFRKETGIVTPHLRNLVIEQREQDLRSGYAI